MGVSSRRSPRVPRANAACVFAKTLCALLVPLATLAQTVDKHELNLCGADCDAAAANGFIHRAELDCPMTRPFVGELMCAGATFTCAITAEARVKCWGGCPNGACGGETTANRGDGFHEMGDRLPPINLGFPQPEVASVACGELHACALTTTGDVQCWGQSGDYLGYYDFKTGTHHGSAWNTMGVMLPPTQLPSGRFATQLSCGQSHCCVVLDDGSAFCWGANDIGQLGDGGYNAQHGGYNSPSTGNGSPDDYGFVQVPTGNHVLKIVCGNRFTCAILDDHSVVCFGNGANGRLGNGGVGNACKDWNDGTCGDGLVRVNLGFARGAVDVAVGYDWACAVLDDGGVLCWGNNVGDTLGYESAAHGDVGDALLEPGGAVDPIVFAGGKAVKIYGMSKSRCVILDNGDIACWGDSTNGQLGVGTDGSLSALREHTDYPNVDLGGRKAFAMAQGGGGKNTHQCAMLRAADCETCVDEIKCWGFNSDGRLGYGDARTRGAASGDFKNDVVDLGAPGVHPAFELGGYNRSPEQTPPAAIVALSVGSVNSCAILALGRVVCWGSNSDGQLGSFIGTTLFVGDSAARSMATAPIPVFFGYDATKQPGLDTFFAKKVVALVTRTCAILDDDSLTCWGQNNYLELGFGPAWTDRGSSVGYDPNGLTERVPLVDSAGAPARVVDVCGGTRFTCAATTEGAVWCWGRDAYGQLGKGTNALSGTAPGPVDLGVDANGVPLRTVGLTCADHAACAIFDDGRSKCWGYNNYAQLGIENTADNTAVGDDVGEMGNALPFLHLGENRTVLKMSAGSYHFCAVLDSFELKCWGRNYYGTLGLGRGNGLITLAGHDGSPYDERATIVDFGNDASCRPLRVVDVALMGLSTCASFDTGQVKCFGINNQGQYGGQLGLGVLKDDHRGDVAAEMGDGLPFVDLGTGWRVKRLAVSSPQAMHMCAVLVPDGSEDSTSSVTSTDEPEKIKCWGDNQYAQLGVDDKLVRGVLHTQMGNALPFVSFSSRARTSASGWRLAVSPDPVAPTPLPAWVAPSAPEVPVIDISGHAAVWGNTSRNLRMVSQLWTTFSNDGPTSSATYPLPNWAIGAPGTTWTSSSGVGEVVEFNTSRPVVVRVLIPSTLYSSSILPDMHLWKDKPELRFAGAWRDGVTVRVLDRTFAAGTNALTIKGQAYFLFFAPDFEAPVCHVQPDYLPPASLSKKTYAQPHVGSDVAPWLSETDAPLLWTGARPLPLWSLGAVGTTFGTYDQNGARDFTSFTFTNAVVVRLVHKSRLELFEFGNWTRRADLDWTGTGGGAFENTNKVYERFFEPGDVALDTRASYRVSDNFWYQFFVPENFTDAAQNATNAAQPMMLCSANEQAVAACMYVHE